MNRTVVFAVFASIGGILIIGMVFLTAFRPEATATMLNSGITVMSLVSVFAGTAYGFGKLNEKVEEVKTQTNGTLTKKDEEIARLKKENDELKGNK